MRPRITGVGVFSRVGFVVGWRIIAVLAGVVLLGGLTYWKASSGYHGKCFQYIAIDVAGPTPPDMTGIAAWVRVPDDGYEYYSSDCSDESRAT